MSLSLLAAGALMGVSVDTSAWSQEVHRRIAIDAVNYMKANPSTTNYAKLLNGATTRLHPELSPLARPQEAGE